MPKPRAKSKPRKKAVKKQRGGMTPANPRSNAPSGLFPRGGTYGGQRQAWPSRAEYERVLGGGRPPVNPNRENMLSQMSALQAQNQRDFNSRLAASTTPPRRPPPPPIRPGYQRGGMTPSDPTRNPNQRGAINQQVRAGRRGRGRGLGGYGGPRLPTGPGSPQDFPNPRQIPHQGPGPARQPAIDPARMADLNRLLGGGVGRRPTTPRRPPPPPIRPGYQRGGSFTGPANPRVDTPPSWAQPWMYQQGPPRGGYGRPGSPGGWGPQRPAGGATYGGSGAGGWYGTGQAGDTTAGGPGQAERLAGYQAALNERYQGRLGTGIGGRQLQQPPRRPPPPPIRPGYQGGGELDPPLPSPRMTQEDRRRRGRAPGGRRRGAGAPMGIPPQVARILQKLRNVPSLPPGY